MPRLADSQLSHHPRYQSQMPAHAHTQSMGYTPQPVAQGYQSQQVSPLSTSNNESPTSPKPYHGQRLRPLYIPAVLRPTERPYKNNYGAKYEGEAHEQGQGQLQGHDDERPMSSASSFISLPGLRVWGGYRRRTSDDGKGSEGEWDLDLFPKPTAPPTRQHWKVSS